MSPKKELLEKLIDSLKNNPRQWSFNDATAKHGGLGMEIWLGIIPILGTYVYSPSKIRFSLLDTIRLYRALQECKAKYAIWVLEHFSKR